jgi:hypothetical protein
MGSVYGREQPSVRADFVSGFVENHHIPGSSFLFSGIYYLSLANILLKKFQRMNTVHTLIFSMKIYILRYLEIPASKERLHRTLRCYDTGKGIQGDAKPT